MKTLNFLSMIFIIVFSCLFFGTAILLGINETFNYRWIPRDSCVYQTKEGFRRGICPQSDYQCLPPIEE